MPDEESGAGAGAGSGADAVADGARLIASLLAPAGEGNIESLAITVFTAAAREADEDLRQVLERIRAVTAARRALRALIDRVHRDMAANVHRDDSGDVLYAEREMGGEAGYHDGLLPVVDVESAGGVRFVRTDLHPRPISSLGQLGGVVDELRSKLDSLR